MISTLYSRRSLIIFVVLLALTLVACERPLQEEEAPTATPEPSDAAPAETQPDAGSEAPAESPGEAAPTLVPTVAAPAGEVEQPAEPAPEQPAPEGGEPAPAPEGGAEEPPPSEPSAEPQPEPTAPPPPAVQLPTGEQIHTVQPGQNLYRIGLQYGCTVAELTAYNGIFNPNYITVGQEIRIPANCGG